MDRLLLSLEAAPQPFTVPTFRIPLSPSHISVPRSHPLLPSPLAPCPSPLTYFDAPPGSPCCQHCPITRACQAADVASPPTPPGRRHQIARLQGGSWSCPLRLCVCVQRFICGSILVHKQTASLTVSPTRLHFTPYLPPAAFVRSSRHINLSLGSPQRNLIAARSMNLSLASQQQTLIAACPRHLPLRHMISVRRTKRMNQRHHKYDRGITSTSLGVLGRRAFRA